jgi:NADH dehydrogenase FAD-containing subunit
MTDGRGVRGPRRRVVIVGGGFGGLFAARALRRAPVQVTLVDRDYHHLFQPLLYQCATGILSEGQIAAPLRSVLKKNKNVQVVLADATGIDADARKLIAVRPIGDRLEFEYDDLIVAAGMRQSYFGHDEFAPIAPGMKTISDVLTIRRRVFGAFEMAETTEDPVQRRHWLTFALVGAGPTGVELAGQIRELATKTLRAEYRRAKPEEARVLLFDGGSAPLAAFGPKLSAKVEKTLAKLGVEMHMGSIVTDIDMNGLAVRDHEGTVTRYDAGTVLWTAGVEAPAFAKALAEATGAEHDRAGRIVVQPDHPRSSRDLRHRRSDEPQQAARRRGSRHAGRPVRRAPHPAQCRGTGIGQAVPLPRPRLGRLHLPRQCRHVGRADADQWLCRLGRLAVHPHRVPNRIPQPSGGHPHLVVGLLARPSPRTRLHHSPGGRGRRYLRADSGPATG